MGKLIKQKCSGKKQMALSFFLSKVTIPMIITALSISAHAVQILYDFEGDSGTTATDKFTADGIQNCTFHNNARVDTNPANAMSGSNAVTFGTGSEATKTFNTLELNEVKSLGRKFTLSILFKLNSCRGANARLFSSYRGRGPVASNCLIMYVTPDNENSPYLTFRVGNNMVKSPNGIFSMGIYHHAAATYDDGAVKLYFDGREVASGACGSGAVTLERNLCTGEDAGGEADEQLVGNVDDIQVYDRVLTLAEIQKLQPPKGTTDQTGTGEPIDIGSRLELFVDDYLIARMDGAELRLHKPTPRDVVIVFDEPWEGCGCHYITIFQDGDLYRMYYRGLHNKKREGEKERHQFVCYAESNDGIHFIKPELGLVEFEGSKKNNIIRWGTATKGIGVHNFTPFKDTNPNCKPDEKYKALGMGPGGQSVLYAFKSSDGIHWSLLSDKPVITKGAFDSQNVAFWDVTRKRYVEFHRKGRGVRDIMTCISTDFRKWTDPVFLQYPGAPIEHLYTNAIRAYYRALHIFIGFPKRFFPNRMGSNGVKGVSDGIFMTSRDGQIFKRWGEAIIRPGLQQERWVNRNNLTSWGLVETKSSIPGTPNELSIYSIEGAGMGESCSLRRFTYRIDGFVSVQASLKGGEMVTKPLKFQGKELVINFSTSAAGSIRVEIQDAAEEPIPGFNMEQCPDIYGDSIEEVVKWKAGSDISGLEGKPVRLRFVLKDADLYSMRFR